MTLGFDYAGGTASHNNGNLLSQTLTAPKTAGGLATLTQYYQYDGANRLTLVSENPSNPLNPVCQDTSSQWCEKFTYDIFGNRLISTRSNFGPALTEPSAYYAANNRIVGSTWVYDARGNITGDPTTASNGYSYDAESRQVGYTGTSAATYVYDGDGLRVKKMSGGTTTVFVYDAQAQLAAEYSSGAGSAAGRNYLTVDHLGSTRLITDAAGAVLERHDYRPFGDEVTFGTGSVRAGIAGYGVDAATRLKFTGKERDGESGLDWFGARYLSGAQGRWTSPDWSGRAEPVPYAKLGDPQTLDLYGYVRNNPLSNRDLDGHGDQQPLDPAQIESVKQDMQTVDNFAQAHPKTMQVAVGAAEIGSAIVTFGSTLEAAAAGLAFKAAFLGIGSVGLGVSGTHRIVATAAGQSPEKTEKVSTALSAVTTPAGMVTTVATGSIKLGAAASDLTTVASAIRKPTEAAKDTGGTLLAVKNLIQDIKDVFTAPPPPPRPSENFITVISDNPQFGYTRIGVPSN